MNTSTLLLAAQLVKAPLGRKFASLAAFTIICTVNAGTINVTNTNDNLAGSLRQAIQDAAPGDTIVFGIPTSDPGYNATIKTWTISLTSAELIIGKNLTIAAGAKKIVVARSSAIGFRIFNVTGGTVTLANLTIANGSGFTGGG